MIADQSNNLLMRLHRWARKQDENFTTEAFVHLIVTLIDFEPQIAIALLSELTDGSLRLSKKALSTLKISTQVQTDEGKPDIEIRTKDWLVYVEVKVDSTLGKDQLEHYREALKKSHMPHTALVLLTRYTSFQGTDKADVFIQWYRIADWLQNALPKLKNQQAAFLAQQFIEYLKLHKMTFEPVEGEIAKSVQSLARLMDQGDRLPKRIGKLERLTELKELLPLHNVLMMLSEILTHSSFISQAGLNSGKHRGGWIGFNLDRMKYFIGFYYDHPKYVTFDTLHLKIDKNKYLQVKKGELFTQGKKLRWQNRLNLSSSKLKFHNLSKDQQMKVLMDFLRSSYQVTEKIKK